MSRSDLRPRCRARHRIRRRYGQYSPGRGRRSPALGPPEACLSAFRGACRGSRLARVSPGLPSLPQPLRGSAAPSGLESRWNSSGRPREHEQPRSWRSNRERVCSTSIEPGSRSGISTKSSPAPAAPEITRSAPSRVHSAAQIKAWAPKAGSPSPESAIIPVRGSDLDVRELGLVDDAFGVVRERAGLQADDVLAADRIQHGEVRGLDDQLLEDHIGVLPAVRILQVDLVALLQILEVVEGQIAVRPWEPDAVSRDVDVGVRLPREAGGPQVDGCVIAEQRRVGARSSRYGVVFDLFHRRNRELEILILGRW